MITPEDAVWHVVMPIKRPSSSKTRLGGRNRAQLALAFAVDTMDAVRDCPAVSGLVVVTDDPEVSILASRAGALVVAERHDDGVRGFARLNAAIGHGVGQAGLDERPVAVLTADLPALRPFELAAALSAAARFPRAFVADHTGTGTSMLAARRGRELAPLFGVDSAAAHEASGAHRLALDAPGLRLDIDLPADLDTARELGVGRATTRLLSEVAGAAEAIVRDH